MRATGAEELQEEILLKKAEGRVGSTLRDKWRLDSLIGVGGMGAVYRATHRNGMRGAVKLLHPERAADEAIRKRFLREGYIANKVEHEGAVRILDDDEADGTVFLVMELLEGMTLEEMALREGGVLSPEATMLAIDQLLGTLAAAHAKGIVHRDIKPANLFMTREGVAKVLDYGIAGLNEPSVESRSSTQTGVGMGTPAFMAPEQARGRWDEVDARSDVFSLGSTMFWLLSGTTIHDEGTVPEQLAATFMVQARTLRSIAPDVPRQLAAVVDRALRLEKSERWPDAHAMQEALAAAYQQIHGKPLRSARSTLPAPPLETTPSDAPPKPTKHTTPGRHVTPARHVTPSKQATPARGLHASSLPPAQKHTLSATETDPPEPAMPRRRAVLLVGMACALATIAFFGGSLLRRTDPGTNAGDAPSSTVTMTTATTTPAGTGTTVTAPASGGTMGLTPSAVTSTVTAPSSAKSSAVVPSTPDAAALVPGVPSGKPGTKAGPNDAGKRSDARAPEDTIF